MRIALDLLGGDRAPEVVVDGALLALDEQPGIAVTLVGPADLADRLLAERGATGRCSCAHATQTVGMAEDPARAVRAKRDATVRVAARLVRDGGADATVSVGSTGAAMAAALFTLGRLPGVTRPPLAVLLPALKGPVVLLDAGANLEASADLLAQFALAGAAYARVRLGLAEPRVGLLSVGAEPGKGDPLRKEAHALLAGLPVAFVGNVEGGDVPLGGAADVVVADGFTGNVLLKTFEGALRLFIETARGAGADPGVTSTIEAALQPITPEALGGAVLLGVDGVSVIGHGASSARAVASCIKVAALSVTEGLVPRTATALADLVARRRQAAGLTSTMGAGS